MGVSVRETTYVAVQQASKEIIAKLEDVHHSVLLAQDLAEMVHANQITLVAVIKDGLENCAIKISLGLKGFTYAMLRYYCILSNGLIMI